MAADDSGPTETIAMVVITILVIAVAVNLAKGTLGQWVASKFAQGAPAGVAGPFSFTTSTTASGGSTVTGGKGAASTAATAAGQAATGSPPTTASGSPAGAGTATEAHFRAGSRAYVP